MTLYEIAQKYLDAVDHMEVDEDGCIVNGDEIDFISGEFDEKAENVALVIKELNANVKAIKEEADNLKKRKETLEKKAEWLTNYLSDMMTAVGKEKFETGKVRLSYRKSESVEIADETLVPEAFVVIKTTTTPDKTAIKKALKEGETIPGCLLVEKQNIQIK